MLLATDPDREGESISWHLQRSAEAEGAGQAHRLPRDHRRGDRTRRIADAHDVDENLVRAQESRRILDRLYGYTLSPVLWKKVQTGLSAGRVQSVAVRLIVEREEERLAFRTATYWDLEAQLAGEGREFSATLVRLGDAARRDRQGLRRRNRRADRTRTSRLLDEADGRRARRRRCGRTCRGRSRAVEEKPGVERPAPPFTTSTLTQEASRKLGFSTERTMQVAQRLFQGMELATAT